MVAFIYDNLILTIGQWIGTGDTLEVFSLLRYLLKVFLTPTFVFIAWDILRRLQVEWSEYLSTRIIFNVYTLAVTVIGVYTEILWNTLEPYRQYGILQYIPHDHHVSMVIFLTVIPLFIAGILLWQKNHWPILLIGMVCAFGLGTVACTDSECHNRFDCRIFDYQLLDIDRNKIKKRGLLLIQLSVNTR